MAFEKCVDKGGNNGDRDTAVPASVSNSRASATVAARQLFKNNNQTNTTTNVETTNVETTNVKLPNSLNFRTTLRLVDQVCNQNILEQKKTRDISRDHEKKTQKP